MKKLHGLMLARLLLFAVVFSFLNVASLYALPAFPGAEGFGTDTPGGRGGPVLVVTNRNASGPGSFREAMLTPGPRIIVFQVSGVIDLGGGSDPSIELTETHSHVTVLGQSSPGGITFINGSIGNYHTNVHDVVIRFIRMRSQAGDTIGFNPVYNLVVDHSDFSGASDETFDIDASHDFTVQWSTILNSMSGPNSQNYGILFAYGPNNNITFHHNFSAHHIQRCGAQFHWLDSGTLPSNGVNLDLRNNIFYNCGFPQIFRVDDPPSVGTNFNLIGNYAMSGPNTPTGSMLFGLDGTIYMSDNLYPGQSIMSPFSNPTYLTQPHSFPAITTTSAIQARDDVFQWAGSWPRDAMTTRTINETLTGTGALGKLDDPLNTATGPAPLVDSDVDGIPDGWESSHGLDPNNAQDSRQIHASGYAHIEVYLNEVAQQITGQIPSPTAPPSPDLVPPSAPTNLNVVVASASSGDTSGGSGGAPSSPPPSGGGTSGGSGAAPSYVSSMAAYEVKSLTGSVAPSNGTLSMKSITPSEWLTNDPAVSNLEGVIIAWSGGAKGIGSRLMVHGGGHNNSANNGLYIFDFAGTDRPNGWVTPLVISHVADVVNNAQTYSDGKPTSIHTYDGVVYAHHNNHMYRFMGAHYYIAGGFTRASFKFNLATNQWTQLPDYPSGSGGAKTIYDPVSGNIFVTKNDATQGHFYRTSTDTWSGVKSFGGDGLPFNSSGAWDSSRNRGLIVSDGEMSVLTLNFSNETVALSTFSPSGATEIFGQSGISVFYDAQRDVYWLFGGFPNSPGWTNLYEMQAGSWVVTKHALTGASIFRESDMNGSFGRFVFMDQWRAIGVVASHTSPVSVIKLP